MSIEDVMQNTELTPVWRQVALFYAGRYFRNIVRKSRT